MQLNMGYNGLISQLFHNWQKKKKHLRFRKCFILRSEDTQI